MNIKKLFGKRNEIIGGHFNELRSKLGMANHDEEYIFAVRTEICNACPLKNGNNCNALKWMNPHTLEVADSPRDGFVRGCGCRLSAKQRSKLSLCPAGFWGGEFNRK